MEDKLYNQTGIIS